MRNLTRRGLLKAAGIATAAAAGGPLAMRLLAGDAPAATTAPAEPVTITLFNTGDLHDHSQSLAQIAGYVKAARAKDPNTLFVDAGDIWNKGEDFMAATRGEGMFHLMSKCGYDAVILGNWDYLYGKDRLLEVANLHKSLPLVLCNMKWEGDDIAKAKHIPKYKLYTFGGATVSVCGGGSHYNNHMGNPPVPYYHERIAYRDILPEIKKSSPDIMLFVSHLFDGSDENLLNAWKDDSPVVMIGGHTHATRSWQYQKTLVCKAGWGGYCLGKTVITWNPTDKSIRASFEALKPGADWPQDEEIAELRKWYAAGRPKKTTLIPVATQAV